MSIDHASVTLTGGHFQWDDPLLIEAQLTDEERMIRDTARKYAQEKLAPRIRDWNRNETFDRAVMPELTGSLYPSIDVTKRVGGDSVVLDGAAKNN